MSCGKAISTCRVKKVANDNYKTIFNILKHGLEQVADGISKQTSNGNLQMKLEYVIFRKILDM